VWYSVTGMQAYEFTLNGARLAALASGALWWPDARLLCVSDLHFGKSGRQSRRNGALLPPYETRETLARLERDILEQKPAIVVALGDSFDDVAAAGEMAVDEHRWLSRLMAGRRWVWIEGNHDPGPLGVGGSHLNKLRVTPLAYRHIAAPDGKGEISGHYHPKISVKTDLRRVARPCFLLDENRVILPAFGTYTGGLRSDNAALQALMRADAVALLTGRQILAVPMNH